LLSKIEQVEMLIALGRGDKYRLTHIRETLESGKELYISDNDFLQNLVKTHLKDRIYQARIVTTPDKPSLSCKNCGSAIHADEKFCTNCGTQKPEPTQPSTVDAPEPTPEPEAKQDAGSAKQQEVSGFTFTDDGNIGEISTRETALRKPESKQQELKEYEKKYLNESKTTVSWKAYDVKAKKKVEIQNSKIVKMKNGKWAIKGTSPLTGIKVFRIVGNEKPALSSEKAENSPQVEVKPTTATEKAKDSPKVEKEVVSRYYRPTEVKSQKIKKSKSNKCAKCGSKIAASDMFCTNCGTKR